MAAVSNCLVSLLAEHKQASKRTPRRRGRSQPLAITDQSDSSRRCLVARRGPARAHGRRRPPRTGGGIGVASFQLRRAPTTRRRPRPPPSPPRPSRPTRRRRGRRTRRSSGRSRRSASARAAATAAAARSSPVVVFSRRLLASTAPCRIHSSSGTRRACTPSFSRRSRPSSGTARSRRARPAVVGLFDRPRRHLLRRLRRRVLPPAPSPRRRVAAVLGAVGCRRGDGRGGARRRRRPWAPPCRTGRTCSAPCMNSLFFSHSPARADAVPPSRTPAGRGFGGRPATPPPLSPSRKTAARPPLAALGVRAPARLLRRRRLGAQALASRAASRSFWRFSSRDLWSSSCSASAQSASPRASSAPPRALLRRRRRRRRRRRARCRRRVLLRLRLLRHLALLRPCSSRAFWSPALDDGGWTCEGARCRNALERRVRRVRDTRLPVLLIAARRRAAHHPQAERPERRLQPSASRTARPRPRRPSAGRPRRRPKPPPPLSPSSRRAADDDRVGGVQPPTTPRRPLAVPGSMASLFASSVRSAPAGIPSAGRGARRAGQRYSEALEEEGCSSGAAEIDARRSAARRGRCRSRPRSGEATGCDGAPLGLTAVRVQLTSSRLTLRSIGASAVAEGQYTDNRPSAPSARARRPPRGQHVDATRGARARNSLYCSTATGATRWATASARLGRTGTGGGLQRRSPGRKGGLRRPPASPPVAVVRVARATAGT